MSRENTSVVTRQKYQKKMKYGNSNNDNNKTYFDQIHEYKITSIIQDKNNSQKYKLNKAKQSSVPTK